MEPQDARTLSPETRGQVRRQAVRLRKKGMRYAEIASTLGVNHKSASVWCRRHESDGGSALTSKRRGISVGMNRTLTEEQEIGIRRCITDRTPGQYKLTIALWTRQAVQDLIRLRTGITVPIRTVGLDMHR